MAGTKFERGCTLECKQDAMPTLMIVFGLRFYFFSRELFIERWNEYFKA